MRKSGGLSYADCAFQKLLGEAGCCEMMCFSLSKLDEIMDTVEKIEEAQIMIKINGRMLSTLVASGMHDVL